MDPTPLDKYQNGDQNLTFYGVHIPLDVQIQDNDVYWKVYQDKTDVLKLIKKYKKSRFKGFSTYEEAAEFSAHGSEYPNNNISLDAAQKDNVGEKPSQFRGPTSQNLVKLRKGIECGDLQFVQKTIWDNPRYLIGSGDTPSILQEGFRYNALHVAAKSKNGDMCELILNTVANVQFIKKLYADDRNPEERAKILLDLYLNTPDKGLNETPLHFAVKFAAVRCVEILVSFPQCDRNLRNKHDKMPKQIVCDRYDGADSLKLSEIIGNLLEDNYYVPVLRSEDNCAPPVIGHPFTPTSPPNFNSDPLSPRLEIHAYAGPMHKEDADRFRKMWKTPPRSVNFATPKKMNRSVDSIATLKFRDYEKGLERLGNDIARKMHVAWKEYWPFLDSFVDIASKEGLDLLEGYLGQRGAVSTSTSEPSGTEIAELSPMTELCNALQTWSLKERSRNSLKEEVQNELSPFLFVDKSLQVFAKRISNDIEHLIDLQYDTCSILKHQIKQLQLLMMSYHDDPRFKSVEFHLVHSRLARLISVILKGNANLLPATIDLWLVYLGKNHDCFSSDDEGVQNHEVRTKNQHSMCLLKSLRELLAEDAPAEEVRCEEDCVRVWRTGKGCECAWRHRAGKKFGGKRSNSFKEDVVRKMLRQTSRKLSYEDQDVFSEKPILVIHNCSGNVSSSSDDEFYTPPSSPSLLEEDISDDDNFHESRLPDAEVFIEGDFPTKIDAAVFKVLNYADCRLTPQEYPNIYKWKHAVGLYNEHKRQTWSTPKVGKCQLPQPQCTSTPVKPPPQAESPASPPYAQPMSWLRVTGANSPRASLKHQRGNISLNL